jgi:thioredoxin domain-containing protein 10
MMKAVVCIPFLLLLQHPVDGAGKVLELSDRFLPLRKEGLWLMKFYAPWCGHCKKLEPVWKHVAQSLVETPIRVGRVDCTRFTAVASEFAIKGYPTIMFLKGDDVYTYEGDRTREDIVAFARRMMGPPVTALANTAELEQAKSNQPFFLYVGNPDTALYSQFHMNARHFQKDEFMYSTDSPTISSYLGLTREPSVVVFKDDTYYLYEDEEEELTRKEREVVDPPVPSPTQPTSVLNTSLYSWMMGERFPMFVKVTRGRFSNIMSTNKFVVIAVLEENKLLEVTHEMEQFRDMVKKVILENRDRYHKHFQFGWTGSPDLANSVAMETLELPNLLVINSTTYQHHLPEDHPSQLTQEAIKIFLDSILAGEAPSYGGSSWLVRLYRAFYEGRSALSDMWRGNPVLTAVLLGLPMGFLSLIFYSICCADIMDAEEEEEEEFHEKHE